MKTFKNLFENGRVKYDDSEAEQKDAASGHFVDLSKKRDESSPALAAARAASKKVTDAEFNKDAAAYKTSDRNGRLALEKKWGERSSYFSPR